MLFLPFLDLLYEFFLDLPLGSVNSFDRPTAAQLEETLELSAVFIVVKA